MADFYPYTKFRYRVEIDGIDAAGFNEVSGFDANIDVVEYREGNMLPPTPIKLPGLRKYGNITLKWGLTSSTALYDWISPSFETNVERKTITIILQDEDNADVASWQVINAWPVKYTAPDFNATSSEVAIESIEIAHEGMTRTM